MLWEVFRAWMREPQPQLCSRAHYVTAKGHLTTATSRDHSLAKTRSREKGTLLFSSLHRLGEPRYSSSWKLSSLVS